MHSSKTSRSDEPDGPHREVGSRPDQPRDPETADATPNTGRPPLWAPWRMEYILGPKVRDLCIFCDRPAASPSSLRQHLVLAVDDDGAVMLNRYPFTAGHLLVVPRRHVSRLEDLTPAESDGFFRWVREAGVRLRRAVSPVGINYGINEGAAAGAGIAEHLHAHLVPRWPGDQNFMPVIAGVQVMPEYLDETWVRLRDAFADLPGVAPLT